MVDEWMDVLMICPFFFFRFNKNLRIGWLFLYDVVSCYSFFLFFSIKSTEMRLNTNTNTYWLNDSLPMKMKKKIKSFHSLIIFIHHCVFLCTNAYIYTISDEHTTKNQTTFYVYWVYVLNSILYYLFPRATPLAIAIQVRLVLQSSSRVRRKENKRHRQWFYIHRYEWVWEKGV